MIATDITPGATYTVRLEGTLSPKRFRDAVNYIKGISHYEGSNASYDNSTKTWTVTLDPEANRALADLQATIAYGAIVERVHGYTAMVGTENAVWLARQDADSLLGGTSFRVTDNGDGTVILTAETVAYLQTLPEHHDGHVSRDTDGAVLWIEGDGYELSES